MRTGRFPAQIEALRARFAERERELTRRAMVMAVAGLCVGGGAGWLAGRALRGKAGPEPAPAQDLVAWARKVAAGPLDDLVAAYPVFCALAERMRAEDPAVWLGVERLAREASRRADEKGLAMARRVLLVLEARRIPARLAELREGLRRRTR